FRQRLVKYQPRPKQRPHIAQRNHREQNRELPVANSSQIEDRRNQKEHDANRRIHADNMQETLVKILRCLLQKYHTDRADERPEQHQQNRAERRGYHFLAPRPNTATPQMITATPINLSAL